LQESKLSHRDERHIHLPLCQHTLTSEYLASNTRATVLDQGRILFPKSYTDKFTPWRYRWPRIFNISLMWITEAVLASFDCAIQVRFSFYWGKKTKLSQHKRETTTTLLTPVKISTRCVRNRLVASVSTSCNNAVISSSCYKVVTHNLLTNGWIAGR
jgi:hypothetical protein